MPEPQSTVPKSKGRGAPPIVWEIYEQHLDSAAFLWSQWEKRLVAPDEVLDGVAELEERLLAHLDALVLRGLPAAERLLLPALRAEEPERVVAAAYILLSPEFPSGSERVRHAMEEAAPPLLTSFQRALESRAEALPAWFPGLLTRDEPEQLALALDVFASHGMDPGPALAALLRHDEPKVAAAALRAAARTHRRVENDVLRTHLRSPVPALRDAAIEAGLLGGHRDAWTACRVAVEERAPSLRLPSLLLALSADAREAERLQRLLAEPRHRPDALWALGFSGRLSAADACLEWMEDEAVSHLAVEAFCTITGLRLEERFIAARAEEDPLPPLERDDLDADLMPKPEDGLPRPVAAEVSAWWKKARSRFELDRRYLHGEPFGPEALLESLLKAPMRQRHPLALDVSLRSGGVLTVPTRAFTSFQLKALGSVRAAVSTFRRPFIDKLHAS